jgi:hypothetical protein
LPALLYRKEARPLSKSLAAAKPMLQASVDHLSLFLWNADGELLAAFATTAPKHLAAGWGAHALPETVRAFPASSVRLIRPLHLNPPVFPRCGLGELTFQIGAVNDWAAFCLAFFVPSTFASRVRSAELTACSPHLSVDKSTSYRRLLDGEVRPERPNCFLLDGRSGTLVTFV